MNARAGFAQDEHNAVLEQEAVRSALRAILDSALFAKAPRMCHLLSFLLQKKLGGLEHEITEYTIGIDVFRRDARMYDTLLDPVVRVQIGRLRSRLAAYYAALDDAAAAAPGVQISIPQGGYVPSIRISAPVQSARCRRQVELAPLRNLTGERDSGGFVSGLDEELGSRLFHTLGNQIQLRTHPTGAWPARPAGLPVSHRLEGSIRVERGRVRACMRLVDTNAGDIAWLSQFDRSGELDMHLQEELAGEICANLQRYLASQEN